MSEKILLDTDIGTDIDDAAALAYLLCNPECDLIGITTVTGESHKRAMIASAICHAAHKNIPIFPGCEHPIYIPQKQKTAPQASVLYKYDHEKEFPQGKAVEFLRRTIRRYPGEITLLAIGPLTNIALLFCVDPQIPYLLKKLVLMCGVYTNRIPGVGPLEWNAVVDPHATAIVYQKNIKIHKSIGLDVTSQVKLSEAVINEKFTDPILSVVLDFAQEWFSHTSDLTFHDPLAAATIFHDDICVFENGSIEVELGSSRFKGMTYWNSGSADKHHEVALSVNSQVFFDHYFSVFK